MTQSNRLFFVNDHCILCDSCTRIAPNTFCLNAANNHIIVKSQPNHALDQKKAMSALKCCPVSAIKLIHE